MKRESVSIGILLFLFTLTVFGQQKDYKLSFRVAAEKTLVDSIDKNGRLFVFMSPDSTGELRMNTWPSPLNKTYIFAKNITDFDAQKTLKLAGDASWIGTPQWTLDAVPAGVYYAQVLWDQNLEASNVNAPGNVYSGKQRIVVDQSQEVSMVLKKTVDGRKVDDHPLARMIDIKSDTLSKWWDREMHLKAAVLLPRNYDSTREYPIRYNVAGYGGRFDRINRLLRSENFMEWWVSSEAPEVITVYLDGEGPFGDSYQMDSDNSGPYGYSLVHELIPYIEDAYRGGDSATYRFVDGCSTGGWVSLGLQLYYPDVFNGVFSYSPDAIAFENYQLINIYKDENAFVNEFGYERPIMRWTSGEPMLSVREFIQYENVLGASNTYLNSGGQISAHSALYSPKGADDLPKPLFDPITGVIDHEVAEYWKKYDFKLYAKENWAQLGPKIQGKIYVWMGDMDHFYLNTGAREFDAFLKTTENPTSDANIEFSPMEGHCSQFSDKKVLLQIQERIKKIEGK